MSSKKNSYPIPDVYKEIEFQTEHHIDHIGKGFHKKDAEGIAKIMEDAVPLEVHSKCDVEIGPNWGEAK